MSKQILILPGDGIGPEIMAEAVKVLELANDKFNLNFELTHDLIGGAAIDQHGVPLADETLERARAAAAGYRFSRPRPNAAHTHDCDMRCLQAFQAFNAI